MSNGEPSYNIERLILHN